MKSFEEWGKDNNIDFQLVGTFEKELYEAGAEEKEREFLKFISWAGAFDGKKIDEHHGLLSTYWAWKKEQEGK